MNKNTLWRHFLDKFKETKKTWIKLWWKTFKIEKLASEWYFNAEKLWEYMNIDEKSLCWELYTIISNPDLWWKWLVWIIPWVRANEIKKFILLNSTEKKRAKVKEISLDMANNMQNIATWVFPCCVQVIDRFHVMKNVLEDMNALLSRIKTQVKKDYLTEQDNAKIEKRKPRHQRYANWETLVEIVTRWRHQLLQRRTDWNLNQHSRWNCFKLVPQLQDIAAMYEKVEEVFVIYDFSTCKKTAKKRFERWFNSLTNLDFITELQNSWRMIKNYFDRILNYFRNRLTNWYAEWLNSRMQKVISNSKWFKDQDYMIYRMIKIFG